MSKTDTMGINERLQHWTEIANGGEMMDVNTHGETSLERAQRLYVEGKVSLDVFERRLERIFRRRYTNSKTDTTDTDN